MNKSPGNFLSIISAIFFLAFASGANAAEWTIVKIFGQSWVETDGVQQVALTNGRRVVGNAVVRTGTDGKVVLVRGQESMIVGPNSNVSLDNARRPGNPTVIMHNSGVAFYQVQKRSRPHFAVRTPTLAALVKGTKFKVVENRYVSKVWVSEGLVQVTVFATGETVNIKPGQAAVFEKGRNSGLVIIGPGAKEPITQAATGLGDGLELGASASNLKSAVTGVSSLAAGATSGVTSSAAGAASGAGSSVSGTASGAASSVGGALGGLL